MYHVTVLGCSLDYILFLFKVPLARTLFIAHVAGCVMTYLFKFWVYKLLKQIRVSWGNPSATRSEYILLNVGNVTQLQYKSHFESKRRNVNAFQVPDQGSISALRCYQENVCVPVNYNRGFHVLEVSHFSLPIPELAVLTSTSHLFSL